MALILSRTLTKAMKGGTPASIDVTLKDDQVIQDGFVMVPPGRARNVTAEEWKAEVLANLLKLLSALPQSSHLHCW